MFRRVSASACWRVSTAHVSWRLRLTATCWCPVRAKEKFLCCARKAAAVGRKANSPSDCNSRMTRSVYANVETRIAAQEIMVDGLPDSSTPELQGVYAHELKNIALSPDHKLYVSIASSCNACVEDTASNPVRGAIYQYNADGGGGRLFATGIRNAEGLDFIPGTNELRATINSRDEVPYPFDNDIDGDGASDLGKILPAYTDSNPVD